MSTRWRSPRGCPAPGTLRRMSEITDRVNLVLNDFEARVGTISSARGAKRVLVKNAIAHLPPRFTIGELDRACNGISRRTLVRALYDLRSEGVLRCVGRGPGAQWERLER